MKRGGGEITRKISGGGPRESGSLHYRGEWGQGNGKKLGIGHKKFCSKTRRKERRRGVGKIAGAKKRDRCTREMGGRGLGVKRRVPEESREKREYLDLGVAALVKGKDAVRRDFMIEYSKKIITFAPKSRGGGGGGEN